MWVFRKFTVQKGEVVYRVGFFEPGGVFMWHYEEEKMEAAAAIVHYLNGGK